MLFKGYDIRGEYPKQINKKIAEKIGKAFGTFLNSETVAVGLDTRATSKKIISSFISGVRSTGCDVIYLGVVPNPVAYYYSFNHKVFGAYITASHNPSEYTGIKFIKPNGVSFVRELKKIKQIYSVGKFNEGYGSLENDDVMGEYKEFLFKNFKPSKSKVAVETFGGVGQLSIDLFRDFDLDVVPVRKKIDGNFFGYRPEPKAKNLNELIKKVKKSNADFGVAFDGDADRSVFVDSKGNVLNGSETAALFIPNILKEKKGEIVLTADCAIELEKIVKNNGGKLVWWRVGHGYIEEKVLSDRALFAAEQSSHFYFNIYYPFSDGILSTFYMTKILDGRKLSELTKKIKINPIDKFYINVESDEFKYRMVKKVKKDFPKSSDIMDGYKIKLNKKEWVLIRASQTMPEINICLQARNKKRLKELKKKYTSYVQNVLNQLKSHKQ